jgi:uncharacterized protein
MGVIFWFIAGTFGLAIFAGVMAFIFNMVMPWLFSRSGGIGQYTNGGGFGGGSGSSNDSFSGGGGGFSGGGASGDW